MDTNNGMNVTSVPEDETHRSKSTQRLQFLGLEIPLDDTAGVKTCGRPVGSKVSKTKQNNNKKRSVLRI